MAVGAEICGGGSGRGRGSMPSGMGELTCGSSAVLSLVSSKIDRHGWCMRTDSLRAPADEEGNFQIR